MEALLNIVILAAIIALVAFLVTLFLRQGGAERYSYAVWIAAAVLLLIGALYVLTGGRLIDIQLR